jgi:hypothetical protein
MSTVDEEDEEDDDDPYEPLFEQYKKELRALYGTLTAERDKVVKRYTDENGGNEAAALSRFNSDEGPLVHDGRAIRLIRKYWLEIDRLKNERLPLDKDFIEPLTFLVEDLAEDDDDQQDLVDFLTEIAYWPIGLDENNEWC